MLEESDADAAQQVVKHKLIFLCLLPVKAEILLVEHQLADDFIRDILAIYLEDAHLFGGGIVINVGGQAGDFDADKGVYQARGIGLQVDRVGKG